MNSQELLRLYQDGQSDAATAIFDRYLARLLALARSRIGPKLKRRVDAEDVVQSAYRSFFVHAKNAEFELSKSGDLWRLLARITLNKLFGQIEKQTAAKRSIDQEASADPSLASLVAPEPSPAEVVAIAEILQLVVSDLAPNEQLILTSRLQGRSVEEISGSINKSGRTVRRQLAEIRQRIEKRLHEDRTSDPSLPSLRADSDAPLKYSDYVLERLLGAGGMGKVFRAREKSTGKKVAIKALHKSRQSDGYAVSRFVQESQILAQLRHPNVVRVEGLGQFPSGGYFIVMDFIDGGDVQSRLESGPLPLSEATQIVTQVATAVEYAHGEGVVHCDLKPANILLDKQGRVFVSDFGFAFLAVGTSPETARIVGGTPGYIAPEVLHGRRPPSPAADVYALGTLLWTLTTGNSPGDLSHQHDLDERFAAVLAICRRCTAYEPDERYGSAKDLVQALQAL